MDTVARCKRLEAAKRYDAFQQLEKMGLISRTGSVKLDLLSQLPRPESIRIEGLLDRSLSFGGVLKFGKRESGFDFYERDSDEVDEVFTRSPMVLFNSRQFDASLDELFVNHAEAPGYEGDFDADEGDELPGESEQMIMNADDDRSHSSHSDYDMVNKKDSSSEGEGDNIFKDDAPKFFEL
jgi:hypothetical protein